MNHFGQPIVHAFAHHPDILFGQHAGELELICDFPCLRLNVGDFHIRTHLVEYGGESYVLWTTSANLKSCALIDTSGEDGAPRCAHTKKNFPGMPRMLIRIAPCIR